MSKRSTANTSKGSILSTSVVEEASASTPVSSTTDGTDMCSAVAQNINNYMLECHMTDFLDKYGAFAVNAEMLAACKVYMKDAGHMTNDNTWTAFQIPSCDMQEATENLWFEPLPSEPIVEAIFAFSAATGEWGNDYIFKFIPTTNLHSALVSHHMMYACLVEEDHTAGTWPNHKMITPIEATKEHAYDSVEEVYEKFVKHCYHILCDDARRIFIYGMTFIDTKMVVWYFSPSHAIKSFSFDWTQGEGLDLFIQFVISLAMASPEALGIGPTAHKGHSQSQDQHYIYELDSPLGAGAGSSRQSNETLYFKTVRILSQETPECFTGRLTRVWVVRQVEDVQGTRFVPGSEEVILKDVWIDSQYASETQNLKDILTAVGKVVEDAMKKYPGPDGIKKFVDEKFSGIENLVEGDSIHEKAKARLVNLLTDQNYRSLFLTSLHVWEGQETKLPLEDGMHSPDETVFADDVKSGPSGSRASDTGSSSMASFDLSKLSLLTSREYAAKRQRRFVYKEVCSTSYNLPTLGDAMDIIHQAFDATQILYLAGWVHRDISIGNILAVEHTEDGITKFKVKLSDIEFAQKWGSPKHQSDPRTGTNFFMPVEIMDGHYLVHSIERHEEDQDTDPDYVAWRNMLKLPKQKNSSAVKASWGLPDGHSLLAELNRFNPSAEWLPVPPNATKGIPKYADPVTYNYQHDLESIWWIIIYFITTLVDHRPTHYLAEKWFSYGNVTGARILLLDKPIKPDFVESLRPQLSSGFAQVLEKMRRLLRSQYIKRALYGHLDDESSYAYVHAHFARLMSFFALIPDDDWKKLEIKKYEHWWPESSEVAAAIARGSRGSKRKNDDKLIRSNGDKETRKESEVPAAIASGSKRRADDDLIRSNEKKKMRKENPEDLQR